MLTLEDDAIPRSWHLVVALVPEFVLVTIEFATAAQISEVLASGVGLSKRLS